MKKDFHPKMFSDAKTTCTSCSAVYAIPTTVKAQQVELCSNCHPVYTGEYRGIMVSGRVDRFRKVQEVSKQKQAVVASIEEARKAKPAVVKKKVKKAA